MNGKGRDECVERPLPPGPALPLIHVRVVDSTQAFLRRHPELHPCAILAEAQTEGRGRQGNRWESAPGAGLWLSASLPMHPAGDPLDLPPGLLLQRGMGAVIAALDGCGALLGLKWPNDLVARRGESLVKAGGILGERVGSRLILGVGVNLRSAPHLPDRAMPAASLAELGAVVPDAIPLALAILRGWADLNQVARPAFHWPEEGDFLRWEGGQGVCLNWEADGRLRVAGSTGITRLSAGEVSALKRE